MRRIDSIGTLSSVGLASVLGLAVLGCNDDITVTPADSETGSGSESGSETDTETGDGDGDGDPGDGDGDDEPCPAGTNGCPCGPGDFCEDPLVCNGGVCEEDEPDPVCGNGILEEGEECDDGPANDNTAACKLDCTAQICGDGFVGPGEACDDANRVNEDTCTNACGLPGCGDGILQMGEECDDANLDDADACLSSCVAATCGDTFVQAGVEVCDDGNDIDTDACLPSCVEASCGDTFVWAGAEACDDGNQVDLDGCNSNCTETGSMIWEATYNAGASSCDFFRGVDVAPNGRIAVVGILGLLVDPLTDCRIIVRVYESDGTLLWSSIPTTGPDCDEGTGADWDANGNLWVSGSVYDPANGFQQWVRRYDPVGNALWTRTFGATGNDNLYGIAIDSMGRGIAVGSLTVPNQGIDLSFRAISANGTTVWTREIHSGNVDAVRDVITFDDDIYVAGYVDVVGQLGNGWAARLDLDGNPVWQHLYNGMLNNVDRAGGIGRAPDGTFAITGLETTATNQDIFTEKLDAGGNNIWTQRWNNANLNNADRTQEVAIDQQGYIVAAGQTLDPGMMAPNYDAWMRKYDPDGNEVWTDFATGAVDGEDVWWAVDIADNGEILVAGGMTNDPANCADAVLRRYAR